jgi:ankyrin repeat protein
MWMPMNKLGRISCLFLLLLAGGCRRHASLIEAVSGRQFADVQVALARGEAIEQRNARGETALAIAAKNGDVEIVRLLLARGAAVNSRNADDETPLLEALGPRGDHNAVELLLAAGGDVNVKNRFGITPLMEAASWGDVSAVRELLGRGADVRAVDTDARNVLLHIGRAGSAVDREMIQLLLAAGADVNAKAKDGTTPLRWAQRLECRECEILIVRARGR